MDFDKLKRLNQLAADLDSMRENLEHLNNAIEPRFMVRAINYGDDCVIDYRLFKPVYDKHLKQILEDMRELYEEKKREFEAM